MSAMQKSHLDLLLLSVLSGGPRHGYAVIEELRRSSDEVFDLPEGTVYPALHRLERSDLLASEWSTAGGRRRRTYHLTQRGREELERRRGDWRTFIAAVGRVIQEQPWPSTT